MPVTQNYEFPLYDSEDSPDLTLTGREAGAIIAIDEALKNEENGRKAADKVLTDNLADEVSDRESADKVLTDNLADEVSDRESADTALGGRIDTEKNDRESADTALSGRIDAEAATRGAADTALGRRIDTEKADRESADTALGERIDTAEAEISENSDDIRGIKSLTYGNNSVSFIELNAGDYDSPALQEIAEQISAITEGGMGITGDTTWAELEA